MEFKIERNSEYLEHHGINGQKWGQRNGPPYPLEFNRHSAAEKKANPRSELTGDKRTDKKIIKSTYNEGKYAKAASVLAKSESDRALKKSEKKSGFKSQEAKDKSEYLASKANRAEENAKYFTEKFQRQAAEFAERYGNDKFKNFKTNYLNKMSENKASRFIIGKGIAGSYIIGDALAGNTGGAVGGGIRGYKNYKDYQRYIDSL